MVGQAWARHGSMPAPSGGSLRFSPLRPAREGAPRSLARSPGEAVPVDLTPRSPVADVPLSARARTPHPLHGCHTPRGGSGRGASSRRYGVGAAVADDEVEDLPVARELPSAPCSAQASASTTSP